ncbi:MAG: GNAT family N-acetyltransferase [Pseudomonadota bacterium]
MQQSFGAQPALAGLLEAASVALIGASERPGSLGTVVYRNLLDAGFHGPVYPVNPRHDAIAGVPCVAAVSDIDAVVDLAVIVTPAATVPTVLQQCGAHGIRAAVVLSGGFREAGAAGRSLEAAARDAARRHGLRFIGPNCLGVMRPAIGLNATFSQSMTAPGPIALVSQSGALCTALLDWAGPRRVGFSCVISTGAAADVDFGEVLDYLVFDEQTEAIMLYVEGIRDARRFMSALRAAARTKPVVVMKAGRFAQGRRAAISHTGALVGADDVFDAALCRAGAVRVHNYVDFFAVAETLDAGVRTRGPRLAVVTNGGGPGVMAADFLADRGLPLAELAADTVIALDAVLPSAWSGSNPLDVLGDASVEQFVAATRACLDDPGVDAVLAIVIPQALTSATELAAAIAEIAADSRKPVLACWMGDATMRAGRGLFRERNLPTYETPGAAVEAFAAAAAHRANQELLLQVPEAAAPDGPTDSDGARQIVRRALGDDRDVLNTLESKALLAAFNIPVVTSVPAADAGAALTVAEGIGFPVAMKIHSPDITHKTDVDGVRLGIAHGREVETTFQELVDNARRHSPDATIDGVLIEPMWQVRDGRELMVGVTSDPTFGPVLTIGLGGTLVEVLGDRAVALPPLNRLLARRMIRSTRAAGYLDAFRGKPAADVRAVEDTLLRLSNLVCELPQIAELDINPLVVGAAGAMALDARVVLRKASPAAREYAHMAIHPYPVKLAGEHILGDGTRLTIRPIRPEDAGLEREFVDGLSDRSRYLRFMYAMRTITPRMVSRFTQIDYDREMALVALSGHDAKTRQIAVARYVADPDGRHCEFAVAVADSWQHRGIGTELLRRLIDIARERGIETMYGHVLRENRGMIRIAKALGFDHRHDPDDAQVDYVSLELQQR